MPITYENPHFPYRRSTDQAPGADAHHRVVVVGAGLVGLTAAVDLALRGVEAVVLDNDDTVSVGSRAICFAKRSLEIYDRLGLGQRLRETGVTWSCGKVFFRNRMVYDFDLLPEPGYGWPAFMNLQQYYAEQWLIERANELGKTEIRWRNEVTAVAQQGDAVHLTVDTPDGPYTLSCDYLLAADGARSRVRKELGLAFAGQVFQDRFLIADVVMKADFPTERWFWFDPPFNPGQSALLHKQPDRVWRIDLQLGWDADPEEEKKPERVIPRLQEMLGDEQEFDLDWVSVYTFQCRRLERFRHGRIFFVGDSAHQVSPFGARGGNGGIQDADNLCWKLALVLEGEAPDALLDSYDAERIPAADENILNSTRSTDFITPKNDSSRALRDAVLELAQDCPFARALVNSGRLSTPARLKASPLNSATEDHGLGHAYPGDVALDAPLFDGEQQVWLLERLGDSFTLLWFTEEMPDPAQLSAFADDSVPIVVVPILLDGEGVDGGTLLDMDGLASERYGGRPGTCVLIRPDQHVAALVTGFDTDAVRAARDRALGLADDRALRKVAGR